VTDLFEPRPQDEVPPVIEVVEDPVATAAPPLLILTAGVRAEQDPARAQTLEQLFEHAWQLATGHVKE
jgi:hypothetical protein